MRGHSIILRGAPPARTLPERRIPDQQQGPHQNENPRGTWQNGRLEGMVPDPPGGPSQGRTSLNPRHYLNNHGNRHEQYIRQLINADRYDIKKGTSNVQEKLWY